MRYFPIKRVVVMTLGGIAFVVSWVPQIATFFRISGVNWLAIISGVLALGFAYWVIIDLHIKLESKPTLILRSLGGVLLTNPNKQNFPRKIEHLYNVLIVNSSPDKTLGIIGIKLQLKYKNQTKYLLPYVGIPKSDFGNAEAGVIHSPIWLQPNDSKEGKLAFVEERSASDKPLSGRKMGEDTAIVIVDSRKRQYIFPATVEELMKTDFL
jgi:hypothetical protein